MADAGKHFPFGYTAPCSANDFLKHFNYHHRFSFFSSLNTFISSQSQLTSGSLGPNTLQKRNDTSLPDIETRGFAVTNEYKSLGVEMHLHWQIIASCF